ncbi:MAG: bifunctional metallophosphatase/5'-nucleotidase [Cellulosilyticaceae bacterium]
MKKVKLSMLILSLLVCMIIPVFGAEQTTITLLHTNDTHANIKSDGKAIIGFGKMATYVEQLKQENNVLVLDAGDMFQGLPVANLEKGHSIVSIINQVGYDAMVPGNHEFDFGTDNLLELSKKLNFPMLSANIETVEGKEVFKSYIVKEFEGVKVGIFGLTTPETYFKTHPNNVKGYEFNEIVASAEKTVKTLKETEQVDVVIMVSHLGLDEGVDTSDVVAKAVEGIDVIVDGHSHTTLPEGREVEDTLIVSTGEKLNNIGQVELVVEAGKVISKSSQLVAYAELAEVEAKQTVEEEIAKVEEAQKAVLDKVVGKTSVDLDGERANVRTGETNLGQLATDAMIKETGAQMAITNGGGIRASIPAGDITMNHVVTVFPFGNTVMVKEIKGSDIKAALEHGVSEYPEQKGAFPHTAGITFTLHTQEAVGNRISNIKIAGEDLQLDKLYTVVTNDFMAAGGDGYEMFKAYPVKAEYNTLMDILLDYVAELGTVAGKVETRMTVTDEPNGTKEEVVEANVVAIRTYAEQAGFKVLYVADTKEIVLKKDNVKVVLNVGQTNYKLTREGQDANVVLEGNLDVQVELKENTAYFNAVEFEALLQQVTPEKAA